MNNSFKVDLKRLAAKIAASKTNSAEYETSLMDLYDLLVHELEKNNAFEEVNSNAITRESLERGDFINKRKN